MTTFQDMFKNSFLEGFTSMDISAGRIMATFTVTCVLACYIFLIYRLMTRKSFYSKSFNVSLAALSLITAAIILAMQSNLVISLGMVGALSIVRFRTAIKDPMDLVFLFWSISVGIICGAGLYEVALLTCLVVTVLILVLENVPASRAPMMLVVNLSDADKEADVLDVAKKYSRFYKVRSRNISGGSMDMIVEVRVKEESAFVKEVCALDSVQTASLIAHDGEVTF
ncbi:MAG TPA: DUF4956 domain-containing protein [Candidatus Merdisoma merdipullorum]|nr:DUF4956 domain-containing protein [Candidatus Merdisoma merdipullorum]